VVSPADGIRLKVTLVSATARVRSGDEATAVAVWAKTARGLPDLPAAAYHPLVCHALDVAAVSEVILVEARPAWRRCLAASLALEHSDATVRWCALFAGLHDLGKASPGFQEQSAEGRARDEQAGLVFPALLAQLPSVPHGLITARTLAEVLRDDHGVESVVGSRIAATVGAHHGSFPKPGAVFELGSIVCGDAGWAAVRTSIARRVAEALSLMSCAAPGALSADGLMVLAGLTSVADWIASAPSAFPLACPDGVPPAGFDSRAYLERARGRARAVIAQLGWTGWSGPTVAKPFGELFPHAPVERPVQREARRLADALGGPVLVIVEAETGSGKTEAALSAAEALFVQGRHEGLFFALPTRATSDQMFARVRDFLACRYPRERLNLHLLHGSSAMSVDYQALLDRDPGYLGVGEVFDDDEVAGGGVAASAWFAQRKRGLLSPFAVGTVDQALLAVLRARHQFVRLSGIAGKVVVIDEVHAYDAYMSVLLERLLEWLGALKTSVLLLSATLPAGRRAALERAYARGLSAIEPAPNGGPQQSYPRISWQSRTGGGTVGVAASRPARSIKLDARATREEAADVLLDRIGGGGNAAFVCNTVRAAQELQALFERGRADGLVDELVHSQFRLRERSEREELIGRLYGRASAERPHRSVVVATQVIEQSLDVDFDLLASDLAPVDLLLQRAGRLHRHSRARPAALAQPTLLLVTPPADVRPLFDRPSTFVYPEHLLLRTWTALRKRRAIAEPADIDELIEFVYGDSGCPAELAWLEDAWTDTRRRLEEQRSRDEFQARIRRILPPDHDPLSAIGELFSEDDSTASAALQALTRLSDPSVPVVLLRQAEQRELAELPPPTNRTTARWLLERALGVSNRRLYRRLVAQPERWPSVPLLRGHRLLVLDDSDRVMVEDARVWLDDALGLVVEHQKAGSS
jgi:CRISPR-associated endonuclease/helicase Cas3